MGLRTKIAIAVVSLCFVVAGGPLRAADTESMSLDSLMNIPITAASKHEQTTLEAPASVTIISAEDIRAYGWRTLEDALNSVRGFYLTDDRNYSFLGVRGYQRPSDYNNRVLFLLNGHALNEMTQGQPPINRLFALDLGLVDRIEVVRGPGSAVYGTNAMFAVINVVTKRPQLFPGPHAGVTATSPGGVGAFVNLGTSTSNGLGIAFSAQASDQRGDDLYLKAYDDSVTNNGVAERLDWERTQGAFLGVNYGQLAFNAYIMARWKGVPTATWYTTFNDSRSKTEDTYAGMFIEHSAPLSSSFLLYSKAYLNSFHYDGLYPYEPESPDNPDYLNERRAGVELRGDWSPLAYEQVIFGAELANHFTNDYWSGTSEEVISDEKHPYSDFSLFAQNEYQLNENVILTAGLRQSWYSLGWRALVPRAAFVFLPNQQSSLKLLYGKAFRAPAMTEAYYWYPEQSKSNPDLQPEKIRTLELNAEYRLIENLNSSVSVYDYVVSDLINTVLDESDGLTVYRNTGEAEGQGAEIELNYRSDQGIGGYANWAYQVALEEPGDDILSNSPRNLFRVGATSTLLSTLRAAIELQSESGRYTLYRTKTQQTTLINTTLSTLPKLGHLQATLYVKNVLNTHYEHPGSWDHLQPTSAQDLLTIPQRERSFSIRLEYAF